MYDLWDRYQGMTSNMIITFQINIAGIHFCLRTINCVLILIEIPRKKLLNLRQVCIFTVLKKREYVLAILLKSKPHVKLKNVKCRG